MQLIERRTYFGVVDLISGDADECRLRLQTIEGGNLAGDRSQRSYLQIALFRDLFQAGIVVFQLVFLSPELVKLRNLEQHPRIRASNSGQAEESDCSTNDKNIQVMDWDGDLAKLPVVPPGHKKDVKAFLQIAPLSFEASGPEFQAWYRNKRNACSDHLTYSGCVSTLGMETLIAPSPTRTATGT